jgi:hypothetical protein
MGKDNSLYLHAVAVGLKAVISRSRGYGRFNVTVLDNYCHKR